MTKRTALLIAVDTFEDETLANLASPKSDAEKLASALSDARCGTFEVKTLHNPSLIELQQAIIAHYQDPYPDETTLLFYSGHGVRDQYGELYFALGGTNARNPEIGSLGGYFLKRAMKRSASERQVTILDCCHAGAFAEGAKGTADITKTDLDPGGRGRYTLAASRAHQAAFEHEGRSLYSQYLIEALTFSGDAAKKEHLTIDDVHQYVRHKLVAAKVKMEPRKWVDNETEDLLLARNDRYVPATVIPFAYAQPVSVAASTPGAAPASPPGNRNSLLMVGGGAVVAALLAAVFFVTSQDKPPEFAEGNATPGVIPDPNLPQRIDEMRALRGKAIVDGKPTRGVTWAVTQFGDCLPPSRCFNTERVTLARDGFTDQDFGDTPIDTPLPLLCSKINRADGESVREFALSPEISLSSIQSVAEADAVCLKKVGEGFLWFRTPTKGMPAARGEFLGQGFSTKLMTSRDHVFRASLNPSHRFWVHRRKAEAWPMPAK